MMRKLALLVMLLGLLNMSAQARAQSPTIEALKAFWPSQLKTVGPLAHQEFCQSPLVQGRSQHPQQLLWNARKEQLKTERAEEVKAARSS